MGKKGKSKHLKRKPAPKHWPIHRKEFVWAVKPKPGPHPFSFCLPLVLIIRDILGYAKTRREAKKIIAQEKVEVDGKVRREECFPAGLMDVISIPEAGKSYRVLPSRKGLILHPIEKDEASFKLCRIEDKSVVKGGHIQLNLHDGTNVLVRVADPKKTVEDVYQTLDVLKINLPKREINGHIKLKKDAFVITIGGKNLGRYGRIVEIEEKAGQKRRNFLTVVEDPNGNRFQTILDFLFAVGETKPEISLPEAT